MNNLNVTIWFFKILNYKENVYAAYLNYNRQLTKKLTGNFGLRAEQTDVTGNLRAYLTALQEPPVEQNYLSWFPNIGLNYQINDKDALNVSAGRRINRPDYHVLNPFSNRLSQLSIEKGNPRLQPEIVNNAEIVKRWIIAIYWSNIKLKIS